MTEETSHQKTGSSEAEVESARRQMRAEKEADRLAEANELSLQQSRNASTPTRLQKMTGQGGVGVDVEKLSPTKPENKVPSDEESPTEQSEEIIEEVYEPKTGKGLARKTAEFIHNRNLEKPQADIPQIEVGAESVISQEEAVRAIKQMFELAPERLQVDSAYTLPLFTEGDKVLCQERSKFDDQVMSVLKRSSHPRQVLELSGQEQFLIYLDYSGRLKELEHDAHNLGSGYTEKDESNKLEGRGSMNDLGSDIANSAMNIFRSRNNEPSSLDAKIEKATKHLAVKQKRLRLRELQTAIDNAEQAIDQ